ncbi:MAG: MBL fold metallo-hydrolase [Cereibacter sphaeroides]|uniref:MBL fold metallo-hydrolase n=1 Tax=Cereibacter sphaeroides TaxID=1063 RepID=A0A2W5SDK1_CERSP|nr:MAG: MBL fold metallo-hydrolase [Cereibacter sphaeroides]
MTGPGTNTWIVGKGEVAVIDPGPADEAHLKAILGTLGPDERISHILVTHAHLDHSALAPALARRTGAPVLAFGGARDGISPAMATLGLAESKSEGLDLAFVPDLRLADGDTVAGNGWNLRAIHTPGHLGNHLCFAWGDRCFTGDHVMGWSTSLVAPPEGDMTAYMASLARLARERWTEFLPAHGDPIPNPAARLAELTAHRRQREAQILAALADGPLPIPALATRIYTDLAPPLRGAAERNVLAHLIDLAARGAVAATPSLAPNARFALA